MNGLEPELDCRHRCDSRQDWTAGVLFPLTPTLSLGEREHVRRAPERAITLMWLIADARIRRQAVTVATPPKNRAGSTALPSPWGEGQGEGNRRHQLFSGRRSCRNHQPPRFLRQSWTFPSWPMTKVQSPILLWTGLVFLLGLLASSGQAAPASEPSATNTVLLFSFFRDNGQDGLFLAQSRDGLQWTEIKPPGKSFLQPVLGDKLLRDPCLRPGPEGTFHLVWTTSWKDRLIGYAQSRDLLHWSEQKAIPVMEHEPQARNTWAPELFYDEAKQQWLIFWATTIPGRFPETDASGDDRLNHRMYCTTTKDFETFSPTRLFYDGGYNVIDATLLRALGQYHLIVKDETRHPVKKNLRLAVSDNAEGPFGPAGPPFTISWVEGPSAIEIGGAFYVYFDHYARPQSYGAVKSADMKTWQDVSSQVSLPKGARHGTVSRVPEVIVQNLERAVREQSTASGKTDGLQSTTSGEAGGLNR